MSTFGDKLKRERELRGVTLEEIAEATKIGTRSLKALEDEQFDQLPGGIFNKGFVRAYAKFLGLDEEQAVADFMAAQGEQPATKADVMAKMAAQAELSRRSEFASSGGEKTGKSNTIWITAAILVLITAGVAAGLRYRKMKQEAAAQAATPKPVIQQQVQTPPPVLPPSSADASLQNGATAPTDGNAAQPTAPATTGANPGTTSPVSTNPPAGTTSTSTPTVGFPNTVSKPGTTSTATAVSNSTSKAALELQIHVSRATWLSVQADGKEATTETLRDSATKTVVAQDRVVLTTGNSVDVTCNGKSLGILGADNKRSQLRITADCKVN